MRKWIDRLYGILFVAVLLLPLVTMNFKKDQISEIDNAKLPELDLRADGLVANIEKYINARIGFRVESLDLYQRLNADLFGVMEHPMYMYGEDGHVFFRMDTYISDYQHINLDPQWARGFAQSMQRFSDTAHAHGAEFIYMLIPDKKTVYKDYFPKSIHVKGEESRTDQVLAALSETDVDWMYMEEVMLRGRENMPVCNVMYDAGHWNENGAFLCYQHLYTRIQKYFPEVRSLERSDFDVTSVVAEKLQASRFEIHEQVPRYTLRESTAVSDGRWLEENLFFPDGTLAHTRFINPSEPDMPKLLVFHDSYMVNHERFFTENFSEVTFIHRSNLLNFEVYEAYLERIAPDIVIYENPERVFPITFDKEYAVPG